MEERGGTRGLDDTQTDSRIPSGAKINLFRHRKTDTAPTEPPVQFMADGDGCVGLGNNTADPTRSGGPRT